MTEDAYLEDEVLVQARLMLAMAKEGKMVDVVLMAGRFDKHGNPKPPVALLMQKGVTGKPWRVW